MELVLIGTGHVAHVLGKEWKAKGHRITQVWGRNPERTAALASLLDARPVVALHTLSVTADAYIIAVADVAVAAVAAALPPVQGLVLHTAGTVPLNTLAAPGRQYGVIWPIKMIRKSMDRLGVCTVVVDGNTPETLARVTVLARELSAQVTGAGDEQRAKMHLMAAMVSNFTNHLYDLANQYGTAENIDLRLFQPLIEATAAGIAAQQPADQQAGPAFRGNYDTLERHRALLQSYPELLRVYDTLTNSLLTRFGHEKLP